MRKSLVHALRAAMLVLALPALTLASSHSEAPGTSKDRLIDDTDLYAFVSPDAPATVTIIGNWIPLLEPNSGPNFYAFETQAAYYINIDNVGDNVDHIVYKFEFTTEVGNGNTFLYTTGPVNSLSDATLNVKQFAKVTRYVNGMPEVLGTHLPVAPANVGPASMPRYGDLARQAVQTLADGTRFFAGPRDDPFFVDLGGIFDLLTIRRLPGDRGRGFDGVAGYNVMSIAIQVPKARLTKDGMAPDPSKGNHILGIYDSARRPMNRVLNADGTIGTSGPEVQVSRLGMPLVNEVVIPLAMKDRFNASDPADDAQFLGYVTNPELGGLLTALFGLSVPPAPRNDLVAAFLTGVPGLNQPPNVVPGERLRLNIAIAPAAKPNRLGVLAGDVAGFPNGRRLADDVVDIELRVAAGVLVDGFNRPLNNRLGDGVDWNDRPYLPAFPYAAPPFSGFFSPHAERQRGNAPGDNATFGGDDDATISDGVDPVSLESGSGAGDQAGPGLAFAGPNPASASRLQYTIDRNARVTLRVYDLQGRMVRTLVDQDAAAGTFSTSWDGRTDDGASAGKGVFFARFTTDGRTADTRKIVLQ